MSTIYGGHYQHTPSPVRADRPDGYFQIEVGQEEMERAYPRLCAELRFAKNQEDCRRLMDDIAGYLNLGNTWFAIKDFGPALSFMILGYLLERTETISNHRGYAFKLSQDLAKKSLDWRTLLMKPKLS